MSWALLPGRTPAFLRVRLPGRPCEGMDIHEPDRTPDGRTGPESRRPRRPAHRAEPVAGQQERRPTPVPVTVWRLQSRRDADVTSRGSFTGLTPRLAAALVVAYTRPGSLVLDWSDDLALAGAAGAGGRRYRPIDDPARITGRADLVVLRADPEQDDVAANERQLAVSCDVMHADAHVAVVVAPAAGRTDRALALLGPAQTAGLTYLRHVIAVLAPDSPRRSARFTTSPVPGERGYLNLLVFVLSKDPDAAR